MFSSFALLLALLSITECYGAPSRQHQSRVYGGTYADDGEFPFVAAVLGDEILGCGATIINENWVMTSANCVDGFYMEGLTIHAGSNYGVDYTGVRRRLRRVVIHPDYNFNGLVNNIALLELEFPLDFGPKVQPITLAASGQQTAAGTIGTVVGWGPTESSQGYEVDELRKADIPVWSDEDCQAAYGGDRAVPENNICAGAAGAGGCGGDYGGPLLVNGQQVGLYSWVRRPCGSDSPSIFMEISYFVDWINSITSTK